MSGLIGANVLCPVEMEQRPDHVPDVRVLLLEESSALMIAKPI